MIIVPGEQDDEPVEDGWSEVVEAPDLVEEPEPEDAY